MRRLRVAVPAMGLLLLLTGCKSGKETADLGPLSDSLRASLPVVSDDFGATCARQNRLLEEIPSDERAATEAPQDCQAFVKVAERLAHDQSVLLAYLGAVGQLASGGSAAFDARLSASQTALSGYTGLPATVVTASTAAEEVLGKLTDLTTRHYRRKQVVAIVRSADPAVQRLTKALREIVVTDYGVLLGSEGNFLANYYEGPIAARKGERLTLILVQRQYDADRDSLQQRKTAAAAYGDVMTAVGVLHGKLAATATGASSEADRVAVGTSLATLKNEAAHLAALEKR